MMEAADTKQHSWVEISYMPVSVEVKEDGSLDILSSDEGAEAAKDEAVYGCWFCNSPLNHETFLTECRPGEMGHDQKEV